MTETEERLRQMADDFWPDQGAAEAALAGADALAHLAAVPRAFLTSGGIASWRARAAKLAPPNEPFALHAFGEDEIRQVRGVRAQIDDARDAMQKARRLWFLAGEPRCEEDVKHTARHGLHLLSFEVIDHLVDALLLLPDLVDALKYLLERGSVTHAVCSECGHDDVKAPELPPRAAGEGR